MGAVCAEESGRYRRAVTDGAGLCCVELDTIKVMQHW